MGMFPSNVNEWNYLGEISNTTDRLTLPSNFKEILFTCTVVDSYSLNPFILTRKEYNANVQAGKVTALNFSATIVDSSYGTPPLYVFSVIVEVDTSRVARSRGGNTCNGTTVNSLADKYKIRVYYNKEE